MGLMDWFKNKKTAPAPLSSGLNRPPPSRSFGRTQHPPGSAEQVAASSAAANSKDQKKTARYMRRELLYGIVRESMIRAGVLSAGYKFKALALDPRGLQFIVMVDLAVEFGGSSERWSEIESMITQSAKVRHGVVVSSVYWRLTDQLSLNKVPVGASTPAGDASAQANPVSPVIPAPRMAAGAAAGIASGMAAGVAAANLAARQEATRNEQALRAAQLASRDTPPISKPMPLFPEGPSDEADGPLDLSVAHPSGAQAAAAMQPGAGRFEPIAIDEVEAFKRALAAGASASALPPARVVRPVVTTSASAVAAAAAAASAAAAAANAETGANLLLTGFEDTDIVDPDFAPPALGSTQYGELR